MESKLALQLSVIGYLLMLVIDKVFLSNSVSGEDPVAGSGSVKPALLLLLAMSTHRYPSIILSFVGDVVCQSAGDHGPGHLPRHSLCCPNRRIHRSAPACRVFVSPRLSRKDSPPPRSNPPISSRVLVSWSRGHGCRVHTRQGCPSSLPRSTYGHHSWNPSLCSHH